MMTSLRKPYIEGLVVREFSALSSNWRSTETAQKFLERYGVPVIWDIDTRALVRHLRDVGALRGIVSTDGTPAEKLIAEARALAHDGGAGTGEPRHVAEEIRMVERLD